MSNLKILDDVILYNLKYNEYIEVYLYIPDKKDIKFPFSMEIKLLKSGIRAKKIVHIIAYKLPQIIQLFLLNLRNDAQVMLI